MNPPPDLIVLQPIAGTVEGLRHEFLMFRHTINKRIILECYSKGATPK